jgi:hypothetical protein
LRITRRVSSFPAALGEIKKKSERLTTVAVAFQATVQSDKKHRHRGAMVEAF